jgi:ketosteroid isomerase-like protein
MGHREIVANGGINMTSRPRIALSLLVLLASAGAILAQSNQKDVDAVRAADEGWLKVYNARDLEKSVAFCDEQASMLAPNTPIATGKAALTEVIKADLGRPEYKIEWHADRVGVARSGDLAYTVGKTQSSFRDESGKLVSDKGKYLTIWKKQADGSWKVLFDTFSSDLPAS